MISSLGTGYGLGMGQETGTGALSTGTGPGKGWDKRWMGLDERGRRPAGRLGLGGAVRVISSLGEGCGPE